MTNNTVSVSNFVSATLTISAIAVPYSNFGLPCIAGDSNVIDINQRVRSYSSLLAVANDFGTTAPEYLAADVFFSQSPQPNQCMIGRWARTATNGLLHGATLVGSELAITNFTPITTGSMEISIDGTAHAITGMNFSAALNLNGVAAIVQTAVAAAAAGATVTYDSVYDRFTVVSGTTGASSSVGYATTAGTGVDVSALLGLTQASGASPPVVGIVAETPLACAQALSNASQQWYELGFAASVPPAAADYVAVAGFILGSSRTRMFGVTINTTDCLDSTQTSDLATQLQSLNNKRVCWWYDPSSPYGVFTLFGRAATINFNASQSAITLAYKQAPGLTPAYMTDSQLATLQAKGGNCNIPIDNGAVMIWPGQMSDSKWTAGVKINGTWFDEVQLSDWFLNRVQTDVFNRLYQATTKVPQTDAGSNMLANVMVGSCKAAVNNGMVAPGQWNGDSFGALETADFMPTGYYIYYPPVSSQSPADRDSRVSVPFQIAVKLAGAVHSVDLSITVDR